MGRLNDALFKPALPVFGDADRIQKTLVFFGGDIQNFVYLMDQDDPNIKYSRWCLEAAAIQLGADFPSHHIVVVKPTRIVCEHISCYDNFVEGNFIGMPRHLYQYNGVPHLEKLLMKISMKINEMPSQELFRMLLKKQDEEDFLDDDNSDDGVSWQFEMMSEELKNTLVKWQKSLSLHKYPQTLVGFSKGCVVLNQFLYEFHYAKRLEPKYQDSRRDVISDAMTVLAFSSFVELIESMYWLDAGHPGKHNVYLTSRALLKTLAELGIDIHLHVSLYQTEDFKRPWVRLQCKEFSEQLMQFKANVIPMRHAGSALKLDSHFNVLKSFKQREMERESMVRVELGKQTVAPAPASALRASVLPAARRCPRPARLAPRALRRRLQARQEILALSLISPHDTPYLGLRTILRHPYSALVQSLLDPSADPLDPAQEPAGPGTVRIPSHHPAPPFPVRPETRNYTVLLTRENLAHDFEGDSEAVRALREERNCAIDEPLIALPHAREEPGVHMYRPCNEIYVPVFIDCLSAAASLDNEDKEDSEDNEDSEDSEDNEDSSSAASPGPADDPRLNISIEIPPDDIEEYSLASSSSSSDSSSSGSMSIVSAPAILGTVHASTRAAQVYSLQDTPRVTHASTSQAAGASTSQGTPRGALASTSQGTPRGARASTSQGTPRGARASTSQGTPRGVRASTSQGTRRAARAGASQRARRAGSRISNNNATASTHLNDRSTSTRYNLRSLRQ